MPANHMAHWHQACWTEFLRVIEQGQETELHNFYITDLKSNNAKQNYFNMLRSKPGVLTWFLITVPTGTRDLVFH